MSGPPDPPTLPGERTQQAWERTGIGFLVSGAIPLLREGGPLAFAESFLAALAAVLALLALWLSRSRGRHVTTPPRLAVPVLGLGTALFGATIVVLLMM